MMKISHHNEEEATAISIGKSVEKYVAVAGVGSGINSDSCYDKPFRKILALLSAS